jgi:uncharacterized protein YdeI (YjbR/CyaY-like superfamily)
MLQTDDFTTRQAAWALYSKRFFGLSCRCIALCSKPKRAKIVAAKQDLIFHSFESGEAWETWLEASHSNTPGIWMRFFKKDSGVLSVTYLEALHVALCFGWIDGQVKKHDEQSWLQKFTPRRPKSIWSKRNREFVANLTEAGKMRPAGLKEVEAAKADGRWDQAYDSPSNMKMPDYFLAELAKHSDAHKFFATLNKANLYAIAWRLQTAKKAETRAKRMASILEMLAEGKKFH